MLRMIRFLHLRSADLSARAGSASGASAHIAEARAIAEHLRVEIARAYLWQGRHDQALASLQRTRELAPQQTRHHPATREVLRMLVRAHRHANRPLARFDA